MNLWGQHAACSSISPKIWGAIEDSVEDAQLAYQGRTKRNRAYHIATPALTICQTCPVVRDCDKWASESRYSGIAGGRVYNNGVALTPPKAGRP